MRIAVLSDIHGNLPALQAVLEDIRQRQAPDVTVNLGDCATAPLWPLETVELLRTLNYPTVRGNHDRWLAEPGAHAAHSSVESTRAALGAAHIEWLAGLPRDVTLGADVLAVHGTSALDTEYLLEDKVGERLVLASAESLNRRLAGVTQSLVLCGHSHHQHAASASGGRLIVNPGSVGMPRYADNADPCAAEAGSTHARYAIVTRRGSQWSADLISRAYDITPVMERARELRREDFVAGFLKDT